MSLFPCCLAAGGCSQVLGSPCSALPSGPSQAPSRGGSLLLQASKGICHSLVAKMGSYVDHLVWGEAFFAVFGWVEADHSFHLHSRGGSCTGWEQFGGSPWNSAHHSTFLVISQTSVPKKSEHLCPRKTGENSPSGGIKTKIWKISSGLFSSLSRQETGGEGNVCRLPTLMGRRCLAGVGLRRNLPGSSS